MSALDDAARAAAESGLLFLILLLYIWIMKLIFVLGAPLTDAQTPPSRWRLRLRRTRAGKFFFFLFVCCLARFITFY